MVQAHGIAADLDEGGMFERLAESLVAAGFTVLRFSFRGHGESEGSQRGITISGELLDLQAALDRAQDEEAGAPLFVIAASFGAVATCLSLRWLSGKLAGLVLWNPVLDLRRTFLEPELPWGLENFGPEALKQQEESGVLLLDGEFELSRVLFAEMRHWQPGESFVADATSALIVHGDQDSYVSYDVAREAAARHGNCDFHTVRGSDHGFDSRDREDEAIEVTADWLIARSRSGQ
ncbi:alpha/beta hydrolase [Kitasatospora viridis]|uniref:alpha/beta hydrolase n=1 Tax=Kitasatospora viridis TaxID=281105 RepID=UPI00248286C1|nr:alpha/beta fold hydrolase [Kitasatospora viridis]